MGKSEDIEKLILEIENCKKCRLCGSRLNTVPGEGNINAKIICISEAPGRTEDEMGRPLVGRSGKLFDIWLKKDLDIERKNVYLANILKCRPPNNRDPLPEEVKACLPYLIKQIKIIQPKIIILLGAVALKSLYNDPNLSINRNRGIWRAFEGILTMPTYHPAYLLRSMSEENKNKVKSDLKLVKDKILNNNKNSYESDSFYDKFFEGL